MARVYVSSVVSAPASKVWERVRDFNALPKWHPRIRDSRIEDALPSDKIGCIRNFNLQNGDNIREQLLGSQRLRSVLHLLRFWNRLCR